MEHVCYLPDNVERINLTDLGLYELPDLSRFYNLKILYCDENNLTSIPFIPTLETLSCEDNLIKYIPSMPKLRVLFCDDNKIEYLPFLPNIHLITMKNNPYEYDYNEYILICKIVFILNCLKLKKKFIAWYWRSGREKIEKKYHPNNLIKFIDESSDWENELDEW